MRLLIVTNRLPVTVEEKNDRLLFETSPGGLVSALRAYLDSLSPQSLISEHLWIGWPGFAANDQNKTEFTVKELDKVLYYPVFLTEEQITSYYQGFCNTTLWPIFHYRPSYAVFEEQYWSQYESVNKIFCDAITEIAKPGDVIWIHDYHLMLLPKLLREKLSDIPIGFFLHIPFPTPELFHLLPVGCQYEIINGLLGADLLGFQVPDYADCFFECVHKLTDFICRLNEIDLNKRIVKVRSFPISIDFSQYHNAPDALDVIDIKNRLKLFSNVSTLLLSVSRLDYTKGISEALLGYEQFLENNEDWLGRITLILIVAPSRLSVKWYLQLKTQIDELVGKINGRFSNLYWIPIHYQFKFVPFLQLVTWYRVCNIAMITPLRDGMNITAKEYVAAQQDNPGILILSETAGAAKELSESIFVNPCNVKEIAAALKKALAMPEEEKIKRNQIMQTRLMQSDVSNWGSTFIKALLESPKQTL